ncbi:MAG TPA: alpha/beta hydrolase, partial [Solirubrobacterales bacterium]
MSRDLAYGSERLQTLDVYEPEEKASGAPVVVFVHGGGFTSGDKNPNPSLYSNVPIYFARKGLLGVTINYRLAPYAAWPAGAEDVSQAVSWLQANAAKYGGDPEKISLFGYSAGATHVASYIADRALQPMGGTGVAGVILVSGLYQVLPPGVKQASDNVKSYFGADASQYDARSPVTHAATSKVPVLLGQAEFDPPFLVRTAADLQAALCKRPNNCPQL